MLNKLILASMVVLYVGAGVFITTHPAGGTKTIQHGTSSAACQTADCAVASHSSITVYTMSGCPHCENLVAALDAKGISFVEKKDTGKFDSYPTTVVAGHTLVGEQTNAIIALAGK